jgi:hypothetical protein
LKKNPGDINLKQQNMKKAGFSKVVLKSDDYDKFVFDFIVNRFDYYDCYFGNFVQYQPQLQFKEFTTLKDDLKQFRTDVIIVSENIDVKQIQSFKRSCELLRGKIAMHKSKPRKEFIMFLDYCIQNLDTMIDKFIDEILASLEK